MIELFNSLGEVVKGNLNRKIKTIVILSFFLISLLCFIPACISQDQPDQLWIKTYNSTKDDYAECVTTDQNNNIFVSGFFKNSSKDEIKIIKYDPYGNIVFNKNYNNIYPCKANDICSDNLGNIYIGGFIKKNGYNDFLLLKYDNNGNHIWNISIDKSDEDVIYGVSSDSNGNIIFTGEKDNCFYTTKFNSDGVEIWNKTYSFQNDAISKAVCVDSNDNILITGYLTKNNSRDCKIIKYLPNGVLDWIKTYSDSSYNTAVGIDVDSEDNIFTVGTKTNGASSDFLILKYLKNGSFNYSKTFDKSIMDSGADIVLNQYDEIILTGNYVKTHEQKNIAVIKFSYNGNFKWLETYDFQNDYDYPTSITVDNHDKIIVTGFSKGYLTYDFITLKYGEKPNANFTWNPNASTTTDNIEFIDNSIDPAGIITEWLWDFGDGYSSNLKNPTHLYHNTGNYAVTLTITDDDGNSDSISKQIEIINSPPNADFNYQKSNTSNNIINFSDLSTDSDGSIVSWFWDFGDGENSTQQNPVHSYNNFTTYQVSLKVTDDNFDFDIITKEVYVINNAPNSNFNYNVLHENTVEFNDSSYDSDGSIVSWFWDFGDGNTSNQKNNIYEYENYGNYTVTLTVTDNDGFINIKTKNISTIYPPSKITGLNVSDAKNGKLNLSWDNCTDLIPILKYKIYRNSSFTSFSFKNSYTDTNLTNNQTYIYQISAVNTFGLEGEKSDLVSGIPTITMPNDTNNSDNQTNDNTSDDDQNNQQNNTQNNSNQDDSNDEDVPTNNGGSRYYNPPNVIRNSPPVADASFSEPYAGFINEEIKFNASNSYDSDGEIVNYTWDFGDNSIGYGVFTTHTYDKEGNFDVFLTVEDDKGLTDTYETKANIIIPNRAPLKPEISGPYNGTINKTYNFIFKSIDKDNDTIFYIIDFDDKIINTTQFFNSNTSVSINHSWKKSGRYNIEIHSNDNKTISEKAYHIIFIDSVELYYNNSKIGYLNDSNSDNKFDSFYNYNTENESDVLNISDFEYLLDSDSDGEYDLLYNSTTKETHKYSDKSSKPNKTGIEESVCPILIIVFLIILLLYLFFKKGRGIFKIDKKQKNKKLKSRSKTNNKGKNKIKNQFLYKMSIDEIEDYVNEIIEEQNTLFFKFEDF